MKKTLFPLAVATLLWFLMFFPSLAGMVPFWPTMTCSAIILTTLAFILGRNDKKVPMPKVSWWSQCLWGIVLAVVLWGVFWVGDKVSQMMFDFAREQVDGIYSIKADTPAWIIGILLLCIIGPAEELFWRGFLQRRFAAQYGAWTGFFVTWACYTFIHIWSGNFMLICAAAACGFCWGILYRFFPQYLPALIISHALWDAAAFVVFPL